MIFSFHIYRMGGGARSHIVRCRVEWNTPKRKGVSVVDIIWCYIQLQTIVSPKRFVFFFPYTYVKTYQKVQKSQKSIK